MSERQKAYYKKYYQEHKEYFKKRNSTDEKKAYYREYYQKNKHLVNFKKRNIPIIKTIVKHITENIIVTFD